MRNIRMTIEYDGTSYHGFQRQDGQHLPTIQETLETALSKMAGQPVQVTGSGRTDAGVHALGQVINFYTDCSIPTENMIRAVNTLLPDDIVARAAEEVPKEFHAQFGAKRKTYRYSIYNKPVPSAIYRRYSLFVPQRLDIEAMERGAASLIGEHNFASFMAAGSSAKTTVRTMYTARVAQEGQFINIYLEANGFLYNMVRIIVGTLLYIGKGKIPPDAIMGLLASGNRTLSGPTVPPHGLFLMSVKY